ncbi:MAG: trypsin-like serine protease [Actinobacteria bacterium]|nr:trypsin-like serine protease [Actinomycetota bacterium]
MRIRTRLRALAAVTALAAAAGCSSAPPASQPPASHPPAAAGGAAYWTRARLLGARGEHGSGYRLGQSKTAHPSAQSVRVGALFEHDANGDHFCTASVVASRGQELLITAAHCIHGGKGGGYGQDIVFIPGYRDGQEPYGVWTPAKLVVAPQWTGSSDPDLDVGFVVLKANDGKTIQGVLGGNKLGINPGYRNLVQVTGYPDSADAPVTCVNRTSQQSPSQLRFDCDGFTGGTSGSPWVADFDPRTDTGTIVGVLGGYQEGGDTEGISYSAYLGAEIEQLYRQAVAAEAAPAG